MRTQRELVIAVDAALVELRKARVPEDEIEAGLRKVFTTDELYRMQKVRESIRDTGMTGAIVGALTRGNNRLASPVIKTREHAADRTMGDRPGGAGTFRLVPEPDRVSKSTDPVHEDRIDNERLTRMRKVRGDIAGKRVF